MDGSGPFAGTDLNDYLGVVPGQNVGDAPVAGALTPQLAESNCEQIIRCADLADEWVCDNSFPDKLVILGTDEAPNEWLFDIDHQAPFCQWESSDNKELPFLHAMILIMLADQEMERHAFNLARYGLITGRGWPRFRGPGTHQ